MNTVVYLKLHFKLCTVTIATNGVPMHFSKKVKKKPTFFFSLSKFLCRMKYKNVTSVTFSKNVCAAAAPVTDYAMTMMLFKHKSL